jgi:hypothetical protein
MKKIILTIVIIASGYSASALGQTSFNNKIITGAIADKFKPIPINKLPNTVAATIAKDFPIAKLNKVYVNANEQYKIELTVDGTVDIAYVDKNGRWLRDNEVKC